MGATEAWASVPPVLYNLPRANARRDWDNGKALIETCMETHNTATYGGSRILRIDVSN